MASRSRTDTAPLRNQLTLCRPSDNRRVERIRGPRLVLSAAPVGRCSRGTRWVTEVGRRAHSMATGTATDGPMKLPFHAGEEAVYRLSPGDSCGAAHVPFVTRLSRRL